MVTWQHINLIGKYEFCLNQQIINIQELIKLALANSEIDFSSQTPNYKGLKGIVGNFAVLCEKPRLGLSSDEVSGKTVLYYLL